MSPVRGRTSESTECLAIAKSNAVPAVPQSMKEKSHLKLYKYAHSVNLDFVTFGILVIISSTALPRASVVLLPVSAV